jgi:hypothetical protein
MAAAPRFHAFISYSHAADMRTAAALQAALQRIGKRWYARSTVRVFRDQTSLAAKSNRKCCPAKSPMTFVYTATQGN